MPRLLCASPYNKASESTRLWLLVAADFLVERRLCKAEVLSYSLPTFPSKRDAFISLLCLCLFCVEMPRTTGYSIRC